MEEVKSSNSLKKLLKDYWVLLLILSLSAILFMAGAVVVLALIKTDFAWVIAMGLGILGIICVACIIVFGYLHVKSSKELLYNQAFKVSKHNIEALRDHSKLIRYYDNNEIEEFREMNKTLHDMSEEFDSTTIAVKRFDFEACGVNFIGESRNICEFPSLRDNITKLILNTQSFRNAVIAFTYDLGEERIKDKDAQNIIQLIV